MNPEPMKNVVSDVSNYIQEINNLFFSVDDDLDIKEFKDIEKKLSDPEFLKQITDKILSNEQPSNKQCRICQRNVKRQLEFERKPNKKVKN